MTTTSQQHGQPAETKPDSPICAQREKNALHPYRPQTLFKSFKKAGNRLLGQIGDATPMRTGKHQVTSQYAHGP